MRPGLRFLWVLLALATPGIAQEYAVQLQTAFTRSQHLRHGVNAALWFSQHPGDYSARHTDAYIDAGDISLIARLGFDHVRLPIDAAPLERPPFGKDGLNTDFLDRVDKAVDTMLANGLAVQIDLHPEDDYKLRLRTDNEAIDRLAALWRKLAAHFATRDPEKVFFEILNEPEVGDAYRWAGIQARVAAAIRQAAPHNTIIATGPNYSSLLDLLTMHPLADGNVIYNFHFYEPHTFTHQGAGWGVPWWKYTHGIPYPPTESSMRELVSEVPEAVDRYQLELYWLDQWNAHRIRLLIDEAAAWGRDNHVPLICNEFGSYRRVTDPASRNKWIRDVRTALEADSIGWAMWDYRSEFGVVFRPEGQAAQPDPATVEALGLKLNK